MVITLILRIKDANNNVIERLPLKYRFKILIIPVRPWIFNNSRPQWLVVRTLPPLEVDTMIVALTQQSTHVVSAVGGDCCLSADRWRGLYAAPERHVNVWGNIGLSEDKDRAGVGGGSQLRRKFTVWLTALNETHNGGQGESLFSRTEPAPRLLGLGLGGGTRSGGRCRTVRRLLPLHPGHPQRTLHGVVAPQRLGAAQEEERRLSQIRLWHGEQDVVPDVPVRPAQLREPEHRPHSDPPVWLHVSGLQVGPFSPVRDMRMNPPQISLAAFKCADPPLLTSLEPPLCPLLSPAVQANFHLQCVNNLFELSRITTKWGLRNQSDVHVVFKWNGAKVLKFEKWTCRICFLPQWSTSVVVLTDMFLWACTWRAPHKKRRVF